MNRLFYGDNLEILRREIDKESIDLCYIDPPFNSKEIIIKSILILTRKIKRKHKPLLIRGNGMIIQKMDFSKFWEMHTMFLQNKVLN